MATEIVAPLKIQGRNIFQYAKCNSCERKAVKGTLTAADIVRIIKESGLTPVADEHTL